MKRLEEDAFLYSVGAAVYSLIELLWRGWTHWTMALTGGFCFLVLHRLNCRLIAKKLWEKCLICCLVITTMEFLVGCVVNLWLKWNVWDYSKEHFQLKGQVCLLYSTFWFLLGIPIIAISNRLGRVIARWGK